ncbi:hypothetical protein HYW58_02125 [Candidatus Kaiserbacteria bacterium]|nr:hypothetical protein [Candidatus Kaiserbacteria bacterium]
METGKRKNIPPISGERRNFLKILLFGSVSFVLGNILAPYLSFFNKKETLDIKMLKYFKVVESDSELKLYNKKGEEVLSIDKKDLYYGN